MSESLGALVEKETSTARHTQSPGSDSPTADTLSRVLQLHKQGVCLESMKLVDTMLEYLTQTFQDYSMVMHYSRESSNEQQRNLFETFS